MSGGALNGRVFAAESRKRMLLWSYIYFYSDRLSISAARVAMMFVFSTYYPIRMNLCVSAMQMDLIFHERNMIIAIFFLTNAAHTQSFPYLV